MSAKASDLFKPTKLITTWKCYIRNTEKKNHCGKAVIKRQKVGEMHSP